MQTSAELHAQVTRQAAAIAYNNDFWLMMWLTLAALPLRTLFRMPQRNGPPVAALPSIDH